MTTGEILSKALQETHYPITLLAKDLKKHRRTIYNWIDSDSIPMETLLMIGKIIRYDFSKEVPALKKISELFDGENSVYRIKYYDLLEDYVSLAQEFKEKYGTQPKVKKRAPSEPSATKVRQTRKKK